MADPIIPNDLKQYELPYAIWQTPDGVYASADYSKQASDYWRKSDFSAVLGAATKSFDKAYNEYYKRTPEGSTIRDGRGNVIGSTSYGSTDIKRYADAYNALGGDAMRTRISQLSTMSPSQWTTQDLELVKKLVPTMGNLTTEQLRQIASGAKVSSGYYERDGKFLNESGYNGTYGPATTEGTTAWYEAQVAAGTYKKVPVGSGFGYIPTGSAADKLNTAVTQARAQGTELTTEQQLAASATGNNVAQVASENVAPTTNAMNISEVPPEGYQEGDYVPSKGKLMPDGTYMDIGQGPEQAVNYTVPQFTNNNNQVYKEWNQGRQSWDVKTLDGKAVSLAEFQNMGLNIDHINTRDVLQNEINTGTDITKTEAPVSKTQTGQVENPYTVFTNMYSQLYESSGAPSIKSEYEAFAKRLDDNNKEMIMKIAEINDNPWLSEGIRQKRVESIQNKYQAVSDSLTRSMDLMLGFYNSAKQDAQFKATQMMNMIQDQRTLDQQLLLKQMDLAERYADNAQLDTQVVDAGGRKWLINTQTGEKIADLGAATSGSGTDTTNYTKALQEGIKNFYAGKFGTNTSQEGGNIPPREKLIAYLQSLFPGQNVAPDVYNRIGDDYSGNITKAVDFSSL